MKAITILLTLMMLIPLAAADTLQTYVWEDNSQSLTITDGETAKSILDINSWETYVQTEVWIQGTSEDKIIFSDKWSQIPFVDQSETIWVGPQIYEGPGSYKLIATYKDNELPTNEVGHDVIYLTVNKVEYEDFKPGFSVIPNTGEAPLEVNAKCNAVSITNTGEPATYSEQIVWGDGSSTQSNSAIHTYQKAGNYTALCKITQKETGLTKTTKTSIEATKPLQENKPPTAKVIASNNDVLVNEIINLDGSTSYDTDGTIVSYDWDLDGDGVYNDANGKIITYSYPEPKTVSVSLLVKDNDGATDTDSVSITVRKKTLPVCDHNQDGVRDIADVGIFGQIKDSFDVNGDGIHNLIDVGLYGQHNQDNAWCYENFPEEDELPICDHNGDGVRDLSDVALFGLIKDSFDVNGDGIHNLIDVGLYGQHNQDNAWCHQNFPQFDLEIIQPENRVYVGEVPVNIKSDKILDSISYEVEADEQTCEDCDQIQDTLNLDVGKYTLTAKGKLAAITKTASVDFEVKQKEYESFSVNFDIKPNSGEAPLKTQVFCGENLVPNSGDAAEYNIKINFGDGNMGTGTTTEHTYKEAGSYTAICTIKQIQTSIVKKAYETVEVTEANNAPVAIISIKENPSFVNEEVIFDAGSSYDADGDSISYEWRIDGSVVSTQKEFSKTFSQAREYQVKLKVSDGELSSQDYETLIIKKYETFQVSFNMNPLTGTAPLTTDTNCKVLPGDSGAANYKISIDFDDGTYGNQDTTSHTFTAVGNYSPVCTIKQLETGITKTKQKSVIVTEQIPENQAPIVHLIATEEGFVNEEFRFDAGRSYDPDGSIVEFVWRINDTIIKQANRSEGEEFLHKFTEPGIYEVSVQAIDNDGLSATASATVLVKQRPIENQAPIAKITGPTTGYTNTNYQFSGVESTDADGSIVKYEWKLDGIFSATGQRISQSFNQAETYTIKLTVTDNDGATDSTTHKIKITKKPEENFAPNAVLNGPESTIKGKTVTYDASSSSDADGSIVKYIWNIAGNIFETVESAVTWVFKNTGTKDVSVTVQDDEGAQDIASITTEVKKQTIPITFEEDEEDQEDEDTLKFSNIGIFGHDVNTVRAGDLLQVKISANGMDTDGRPSLIVPELGIKSSGRFEEIDGREVLTAALWIPKNTPEGDYMLRIGFKGHNNRKGEIRWFKVVE